MHVGRRRLEYVTHTSAAILSYYFAATRYLLSSNDVNGKAYSATKSLKDAVNVQEPGGNVLDIKIRAFVSAMNPKM
jgi:hypothetical protein